MVIWGSPIFWGRSPRGVEEWQLGWLRRSLVRCKGYCGLYQVLGITIEFHVYIYHIELYHIILYYITLYYIIIYYVYCKGLWRQFCTTLGQSIVHFHCVYISFMPATCAWDEWMWSLPDSRAPRQKLGETLQPLGSMRLIKYTFLLVHQGGKANVTMKSFSLDWHIYIVLCNICI